MAEIPEPYRDPWRAERAPRRRLSREAQAERDRYLQSQLEPDEPVVARSSHHWITDRRILSARRSYTAPRQAEFVCESLAFSQITHWSFGRQHDHRPLVRLEHVPIPRLEHVPEHRFLWFEWGNAEEEVDRTESLLAFGKDSDPVLVALSAALERGSSPKGEPFVVRPEGTREERTKGHRGLLTQESAYLLARPWHLAHYRRLTRLRRRLAAFDPYHGHLYWRVRLPSWLMLGIPAWFISPWLVLPAIGLAEVAWIIALQWSWHGSQRRRRMRTPRPDSPVP